MSSTLTLTKQVWWSNGKKYMSKLHLNFSKWTVCIRISVSFGLNILASSIWCNGASFQWPFFVSIKNDDSDWYLNIFLCRLFSKTIRGFHILSANSCISFLYGTLCRFWILACNQSIQAKHWTWEKNTSVNQYSLLIFSQMGLFYKWYFETNLWLIDFHNILKVETQLYL